MGSGSGSAWLAQDMRINGCGNHNPQVEQGKKGGSSCLRRALETGTSRNGLPAARGQDHCRAQGRRTQQAAS